MSSRAERPRQRLTRSTAALPPPAPIFRSPRRRRGYCGPRRPQTDLQELSRRRRARRRRADGGAGEFFTLLRPSGCGKTTLLRTIAGFNRQDSGEILFDGTRIDTMPAHLRNIGMVYQDYAIFPHKSVADNVAFGLAMRHVPRAEIDSRVARALDVVQLGGLATRMPHELSGGQQQRVALARAMVINPQILLMDEPLSNLDAKLRIELRDDIRDLQRSLGITTIYVTHDQEEALVISDRICIMQGGRVHQVAAPLEVYSRPATLFVASFVGSMNVFERLPVGPGGEVTIGAATRTLPALTGRAGITLAMRPEDVILAGGEEDAGDAIPLDGAVDKVTYAGREAFYRLTCVDGPADSRARFSARSGPARRRRRAARHGAARSRGCTRSIPPTAAASKCRADDARSCASISGRWSWSWRSPCSACCWSGRCRRSSPRASSTTRRASPRSAITRGSSVSRTSRRRSATASSSGVGGMLGAMLLGVPLAALTARYVIVGRDFLATLAVLALVSPPFIGAYAWIMMLGRNGFVRLALEEIGIECRRSTGISASFSSSASSSTRSCSCSRRAACARSIRRSRRRRKGSAPVPGGGSSA